MRGEQCVVDDISISVERGQVMGLLGLNGAGKSSTLKMLAGVLAPSGGDILLNGFSMREEPQQAKRQLGYLPEVPPLYPDMRVDAYLLFAAKLRGLRGAKAKDALARVKHECDLEKSGRRIIGNLSKGYKQRVGLAQAIIHSPALIILDEPSSGLDPQQMIEMRALIERQSQDHGVLFSTHLLAEATAVCTDVCVIHKGRLAGQQSMSTAPPTETQELRLKLAELVSETQLLQLSGVLAAKPIGRQRWQLSVQPSTRDKILGRLVTQGWHVLEFGPARDSLEQLFMSLVQKGDIGDTGKNAAPVASPDVRHTLRAPKMTSSEPA